MLEAQSSSKRRASWVAFAKRKRAKLKAQGRCYSCWSLLGESKCKSYCDNCREKRLYAYQTKFRDKRIAAHKEAQQRLKLETFQAYSDVIPFCKCCQVMPIEFLTIDHINGSEFSSADRRKGLDSGNALYRRLKREGWPPGYRVLCMNCNFSVGHFGYCPHVNGVSMLNGRSHTA